MRFLALAALLVPFAASAQQVALTSPQANATTGQIYIGRSACKTNTALTFNWDVGAGNPVLGEEVDVLKVKNSGDCTSNNPSGGTFGQAPAQTQTGSFSVKPTEMLLDTTSTGLDGGCDNTDRKSSAPYTTYVCVQLRNTVQNAPAGQASIAVNFATANPTPPTGIVVSPGDQHLKLNWSAGDTTETISTYDVYVVEADGGLGKAVEHVSAGQNGSGSADVTATSDGTSLHNDVPYQVEIVATDSYGNVSDPSAPVTGTPKAILDFYGLYRNQGGSAAGGGGCSSAGAATWIAALVLATGLLARRRKGKGLLLVGALALLAPAARADFKVPDRPARKLLVALKIDRYDPQIDSEAGLTGKPYHQIFGGRAPLRWQLEVDWEVAHPFGSLLLGVTAGYWQNVGKGVLAADTSVQTQDTALLDVIPFGVIATYRFDWLADRWARFPLIPYAQAGLSRALWASFSGTGNVSKDTARGGHGSGWSYGYTTAVGFALNLDSIDPELAREAFVDAGIQRTSLFAEYGWTRLDNFHKTGGLILTDRAWRFGLAMEF